MPAQSHISLVKDYFSAVDGERLEDILALLHKNCVFTVETHGVLLQGSEQISEMFHRLWSNHAGVRHFDFRFVGEGPRVSVQFQVRNTELDGSVTGKSNCNFFDVEDGRFTRIAVYMAGPNTLEG